MTPETITIKKVESCPQDFHAQISAEKKRYVYRLFHKKNPSPFLQRYTWSMRKPVNLNFLQEASKALLGRHDFAAFQSTGTAVSTTVREIFHADWVYKPSGFMDFHIVGSGFLKQMVRNIVGTLVWLHEKEAPIGALQEILASKDRKRAGAPAPAQGLFLASVKYPSELDNKCRKL